MKNEPQLEADQQTLGNYLQQARNDQNLDISDIAATTRISPRILRAMEKDNYASLPPTGFARGFYSIYAKQLGLPIQEILHRFDTEVDKKPSKKKQHIKFTKQDNETEILAARPSRTLRTLIGLSLVLLVVATALLSLYFSWNPATFISEKIQKLQEPAKDKSAIQTDMGIRSENSPNDAQMPTPRYIVTVKFLEDTVIAVSVDDARLEEEIYTKGSIRNWYSKSSIFIKFKENAKVAIEVNGEPLQLPPPLHGEILINLPVISAE